MINLNKALFKKISLGFVIVAAIIIFVSRVIYPFTPIWVDVIFIVVSLGFIIFEKIDKPDDKGEIRKGAGGIKK